MPQVSCKICHKEFYSKPYHIRHGYGIYCSKKCHYLDMRRGKYVTCHICAKEIWKKPKDLKQSKSKLFFCNKSCQTIWRNKEFKGVKHPNWRGGEHTYKRVMKENGIKPICTTCRLTDKRVLIIHHIDHNRKNNILENLMWLCRNCHYLIHEGKTF